MIRTLVRYDITICGIPELPLHCDAGVSDVLSIMDPLAVDPDAFARFQPHRRRVLRFDDILVETPGMEAPQPHHVEALLAFGAELERSDVAHLLIHCHAGVSRSTAAAALLMAQHNPGREEDAFLALLDLRPHAWPNTRMVEIADRLLERRGALSAGLAAYRRELLKARPHLVEMIMGVGRAHELPE
ncbi:MAG TPA: protein-tyrosine-phosphatase [Dongiaceae bacterium]|nr:protein-tyrosine-phosphatase [Dongiaceae bacterium]